MNPITDASAQIANRVVPRFYRRIGVAMDALRTLTPADSNYEFRQRFWTHALDGNRYCLAKALSVIQPNNQEEVERLLVNASLPGLREISNYRNPPGASTALIQGSKVLSANYDAGIATLGSSANMAHVRNHFTRSQVGLGTLEQLAADDPQLGPFNVASWVKHWQNKMAYVPEMLAGRMQPYEVYRQPEFQAFSESSGQDPRKFEQYLLYRAWMPRPIMKGIANASPLRIVDEFDGQYHGSKPFRLFRDVLALFKPYSGSAQAER